MEKLFESLSEVTANNFQMVMRSNRQTLILEKALNKIFQNFKISTQRALSLWREQKNVLNLQLRIGSEKKKNILQVLNRFLENQDGIRIPYIIQKFNANYRSLKIRKQILTKILQCKAGKVPLVFLIWKTLPNPGAKKLKKKAMKFQ